MCILNSSHSPQQLNTVVPQRDTDQKLKSDIVRLHEHIQSPRLAGFSLCDSVIESDIFFQMPFFPPNVTLMSVHERRARVQGSNQELRA